MEGLSPGQEVVASSGPQPETHRKLCACQFQNSVCRAQAIHDQTLLGVNPTQIPPGNGSASPGPSQPLPSMTSSRVVCSRSHQEPFPPSSGPSWALLCIQVSTPPPNGTASSTESKC